MVASSALRPLSVPSTINRTVKNDLDHCNSLVPMFSGYLDLQIGGQSKVNNWNISWSSSSSKPHYVNVSLMPWDGSPTGLPGRGGTGRHSWSRLGGQARPGTASPAADSSISLYAPSAVGRRRQREKRVVTLKMTNGRSSVQQVIAYLGPKWPRPTRYIPADRQSYLSFLSEWGENCSGVMTYYFYVI